MFQNSKAAQVIGKLDPFKFVKFLRLDDWREFPVKNPKIKVFQKENEEDFFQATIPLDDELSDYERAMFQAVQTVSQARRETLEQTILTLLNPISDVLRFRLVSSNCDAGSVFFDDAIRLYSNVKKLIVSAASDVVSPSIQRTNTPTKVTRFVNACRFSQTAVGTYVVSVVLPLDFDENASDASFDEIEDARYSGALARRTVRHIFDASSDVLNGLNETDSLQGLMQAAENQGLSLDFLKALAKFCEYGDDDKLEISARLSKRATGNKPRAEKFTLMRRYRDDLERAANFIRRKTTPGRLSAVGKIEKLEARSDLETRTYGYAVVSALFNSEKGTKRQKIRLNSADYAKACQAHERGLFIQFAGGFVDGEFECLEFKQLE